MKVKPEENIKGEFIDEASAYLLNHEFDEFEKEIAFICTALKRRVNCEKYIDLPDLIKPL